MTSPGVGKPESTSSVYDDVFSKGSRFGQDLTPKSVRSLLMPKTNNPFRDAFSKFSEWTSGLLADIASAFLGKYSGSNQHLAQIRDGQLDLMNRTDLLSPLLDYCSVSTPPGSGDARKGAGRMPFTYQIGPRKNVTLVDGQLRLDAKGLWDIRAMVTPSWKFTNTSVEAYIRVLRPDGSVFSQQGAYLSESSAETITLITSVVVPEPGYTVEVYVESPSDRGWWTGPQWTRLTVQRISDKTTGGSGSEQSTDPDTVE